MVLDGTWLSEMAVDDIWTILKLALSAGWSFIAGELRGSQDNQASQVSIFLCPLVQNKAISFLTRSPAVCRFVEKVSQSAKNLSASLLQSFSFVISSSTAFVLQQPTATTPRHKVTITPSQTGIVDATKTNMVANNLPPKIEPTIISPHLLRSIIDIISSHLLPKTYSRQPSHLKSTLRFSSSS
jgi:hypothetical protein